MSVLRCNFSILATLSFLFVARTVVIAAEIPAQNTANGVPTVTQLFSLHVLPEPLVPSGGEPTQIENGTLTATLKAFQTRGQSDDFSALEGYLAANPKSPWRVAVLTNLGLLYYHAGYYSKCIPTYRAAWDAGKTATDLKAKALVDRAAGEYTKMLARLGRYDDLKAFLQEVGNRTFIGPATQLMMAGKEGSVTMATRPEISFRCGPFALSRILAAQNSPRRADPAIMQARSTMQGMSLSQIAEISRQVGLNYQVAKRAPGAALIMPRSSLINGGWCKLAVCPQQKNSPTNSG